MIVDRVVGVPLISPVASSKDKPAERTGEIPQEVILPPFAVGVTEVMGVPFVSTNEFGL